MLSNPKGQQSSMGFWSLGSPSFALSAMARWPNSGHFAVFFCCRCFPGAFCQRETTPLLSSHTAANPELWDWHSAPTYSLHPLLARQCLCQGSVWDRAPGIATPTGPNLHSEGIILIPKPQSSSTEDAGIPSTWLSPCL